ncbi:uncharacterized protein JCM15063_003210 [Sporobolomyces koalae]|uniref:uncharacterized protein n=1 Tax=Sporobolomyces koalae TaxID=500713 RepID=UPI003178D0B3
MSPTVAQYPSSHVHAGGSSLDGLLNKVSIGVGGSGVQAAVNGWQDYRGKAPALQSGERSTAPNAASQSIASTSTGYGMSASPGGQSVLSTGSSPIPPHRSQSQWQPDFPPPLAPRNWTVLKEVGDGSFGTVWLADWHSTLNVPPGTQPPGPSSRPEYKGKQLVAIKRMKKAFDGGWDECMKLKELKSLRQIPMHPNIIPLYDAFLLPTTRELYFVFECMEGNLYQLTKSRKGRPLASGLVASIFYQILSGLDHIHSYGYFHRDMKPENLLITTTGLADYPASSLFAPAHTPPEKDVVVVLKLADFGLAREIASKPPYTEYVSTRWYRAPEVLLRSRDYSVPVDMWALGTILVEVLTLKPLFPGDSEVDQVYKICEVLGDPSVEYGHDDRGRVNGGGNWVRGIKMARDVGFAFPKIAPRNFANLFDHNVVPTQLIDCIQDLLRYEPDARLTTRQCLEHAYFREVAYRFAPYSPEQLRQRQQIQSNASYQSNGSSLSVNTTGLTSIGNPSQASPRSIPPSHSHSVGPQPQFNSSRPTDQYAPNQAGPSMQRSYSISSTLSGASGFSSAYPVQVMPPSASGRSQQTFPEGVSDSRSIHSFSSQSPNPMWASGENGWVGNEPSNASMRIPSFGGSGRRPSIAPSIAASTFYDGSIFEGIAPTRASSVMSFPVSYGNGDAALVYQTMDSPQLNRVDSVASVNLPSAVPSSSTNPPRIEPTLSSSVSVKSGKWGLFGGDKTSSSSTPTFPQSPSLHASTSHSLNPLKRSPSNNSIAASSAQQPTSLGAASLDPKKAKKEAERLAKEQEKANRLAKEQAARERARAVMKKKSQLQEAADPLHNFSNHARGGPGAAAGGAVPVDKGKGRAVMSDRMVQQRMPQIIEDTSKLYLSPASARAATEQTGGTTGGHSGDYSALLSARFKARRLDDDDDVHSISSTDTGQSSQFAGPSGLFATRGRPFSISSKATSSSDPERRSRHELAEIDLHLSRAGSVASLPLSSRNHYASRHAPSTGHSSLDSTLINNMQGLATGSTTDLSWNGAPNARPDSVTRSRLASPAQHEQRYSPYQVPTSPTHARTPGPTLAPIQFDPNAQYAAAGHARLRNGLSPSNHPAMTSSASIASYHSTPSVLPSYFQKGDNSSRQLPYLPSMDQEPQSPGFGSTFPYPSSAAATPSPINSASPEAHR